VQSDNIISSIVSDFSGHVYNLQTVNGFYTSNHIISHNCRSSSVPILKEATDIKPLSENKVRTDKRPSGLKNKFVNNPEKYKTSKAFIESQGSPVYKGIPKIDWRTDLPIEEIDATKIGKRMAGYFTDNKKVADGFLKITKPGSSHVVEARVFMKKPFIVDAKNRQANNFMIDALNEADNNPELIKAVNTNKYDGLVIKNTSDEGTIFIPKEGKQIKTNKQLEDIWNKSEGK
jgi:hypothetical protein